MFDDRRSKKLLLVAHCILNQNAKLDACAHYPGAIREAAAALLDAGVGIVQLPCPELLCLGLDREAAPGSRPTVAKEDTRIAARMAEEAPTGACRALAAEILRQLLEYRKHGFAVLGLLGINGSPTCGVETTWADGAEREGPGVFIRQLAAALDREGLAVEMAGIKAREAEAAVAAVHRLLRKERD
ncbi:putative secreted protein [Hydrogenispora ethanolica]|uniref:Putative secreted protein n=1 Tax=Hydrogenispora ethanolica TaxID=1082276 RepID=A0A4R1S4M6_HYDET|nr:CD3072 family TudS-related putative desulfidase [Hydrogenispora ethanolica]TCL73342.1 putative secreted protein [Hydrogenispora ethanolica]